MAWRDPVRPALRLGGVSRPGASLRFVGGTGRMGWNDAGVLRFTTDETYVASFGSEWNWFGTTQLDPRAEQGRTESREAFARKVGWGPLTISRAGCFLMQGVAWAASRRSQASHGAKVVGADLSRAVDAAHANLGTREDVAIVQADLFELPFRPGSFDRIYSIGVLHHTPDTHSAFQKLVRTVETGWRNSDLGLCAATPSATCCRICIGDARGEWIRSGCSESAIGFEPLGRLYRTRFGQYLYPILPVSAHGGIRSGVCLTHSTGTRPSTNGGTAGRKWRAGSSRPGWSTSNVGRSPMLRRPLGGPTRAGHAGQAGPTRFRSGLEVSYKPDMSLTKTAVCCKGVANVPTGDFTHAGSLRPGHPPLPRPAVPPPAHRDRLDGPVVLPPRGDDIANSPDTAVATIGRPAAAASMSETGVPSLAELSAAMSASARSSETSKRYPRKLTRSRTPSLPETLSRSARELPSPMIARRIRGCESPRARLDRLDQQVDPLDRDEATHVGDEDVLIIGVNLASEETVAPPIHCEKGTKLQADLDHSELRG